MLRSSQKSVYALVEIAEFFSCILEIEGLPDLKLEQAFELSDASVAACTVLLNEEPIVACPNDPDDVRLLSEVAVEVVQEVFIVSA